MNLERLLIIISVPLFFTLVNCREPSRSTQETNGPILDTLVAALDMNDSITGLENGKNTLGEIFIATCECKKEKKELFILMEEDVFITYVEDGNKSSFILMESAFSDIPTNSEKRFLERIVLKNDAFDSVVLIVETGQGIRETLLAIRGYINEQNIKIDTCDSYRLDADEKSPNLHESFYDVIRAVRN